jgi:hypothetical protein
MSGSAVVATDTASADADRDNGAAFHCTRRFRRGCERATRRLACVPREEAKARWDAYWVDLCSVTNVMSSSCSHASPVKE